MAMNWDGTSRRNRFPEVSCKAHWNPQDIRRLIGFISFISGMAVFAFLYNPDLFQTIMEYIQNNPPEDKISTVLTGSGDECFPPPLPDVTALQNGQIVTVLWPGNNGETTLQAYPVVVDAVSADGATFMGTPLNSDCTVAESFKDEDKEFCGQVLFQREVCI